MSQHSFDALHLITTPVWLISPVSEQILFANAAAAKVMRNKTLNEMRRGIYSASAQTVLSMYVADLKTDREIIEIWTVWRDAQETTLSCRLTLNHIEPYGVIILFEGLP